MTETYFVFSFSDGDVTVSCMDKSTLTSRLAEDYYGHNIKFWVPEPDRTKSWWDAAYMGDDTLIIFKGNPIVPEPVEIVVEYSVP